MYRDPELPAGFQNADFEMRELEEMGNREAKAKQQGKCAHGWRQGKPGMAAPKDDDIQTCLDCGKVATRWELDGDRDEILHG